MPQTRKVAALDGLRALAIAAVVAYHANQALLPGGFYGVTVFFVLTGYLTTLSVARRLSSEKGFSYLAYLKERARRLWPSMLVAVGATALLTAVLAPSLLAKVKADAAWALLFAQNIHYIVQKVSYFAAAGLPSPLTHLWYLGVLVQFQLVWPLFLMVTWRVEARRSSVCAATAALMLASALAMALLFDPAGDAARVYYGPDTRAAELLAGALLALATMGRGLSAAADVVPEGAGTRLRAVLPRVSGVAGAASLAGICALCALGDGYSPFAYRGGLLLAAVLSAILVGSVCEPRQSLLTRVLGSQAPAALGRRAFSVYLWHYPLLILMNPATRTTELPWWGWALEIAAVLAVSEASYRLCERPWGEPRRLGQPKGLVAAECAALACIAVALLLPSGNAPGARPEGDGLTPEQKKEQAEAVAAAKEAARKEQYDLSGTYFAGTAFEDAVDSINATSFSVDALTGATDASVVLVGDSVPDDASDEFYEIFPNGYMDAKIGRQLYSGPDAYAAVQDAGHGGDVVVWSLADNGWATEEQVRTLVECVDSSKKVYLVTCRCPDPWQDENNRVIKDVAAQYENCEVIDWFAESEGHDDWFWDDGEHVRPEGASAYVMLLRRAITGR